MFLYPIIIRANLLVSDSAERKRARKIHPEGGTKINFYENIIILNASLDDKAIENAVEQVKSIVIKKGGEVLKSENWGQKKLAYELKKQTKGVYILLLFKAPPSVITELERLYKVFDPYLKFLIIKLKKKHIEATLSSISEAESKNTESSTSEEKEKNV